MVRKPICFNSFEREKYLFRFDIDGDGPSLFLLELLDSQSPEPRTRDLIWLSFNGKLLKVLPENFGQINYIVPSRVDVVDDVHTIFALRVCAAMFA